MSETHGRSDKLTPQQQACREEWRALCQALERAQGEQLNQNCGDKYQFAATYLAFGRDLEATIADVRQRAHHGKYAFFSDRGINAAQMTPSLADRMLRDWQHAVESKREQAALVFHSKFGQPIGEYVNLAPHEVDKAAKMNAARSLIDSDAIIELAALPLRPAGGAQLTSSDVTAIVQAELTDLAQMQAELLQLKADVERILDHLGLKSDKRGST
ncbi:MAG: hypothetical protein IIA67_01955 [Planctomycetes bacterium]|nr:hypothetical protein [Planctomycetota bacterium]